MLGHLIYNYEHLDDVRIQQEISKKLYPKKFKDVYLVHAYNGKKEFGYKKYLENKLITLENRGHFRGASDLINKGLDFFTKNKIKDLQYVLVTAADTWVLNTEFLYGIVQEMQKNNKVLAASSWSRDWYVKRPVGFSTDFFIIDIEWNRTAKLFPVDYDAFFEKFKDFFALQYRNPNLENAVQYTYQKYFIDHYVDNDIWRTRDNFFRRIIEREPIHTPEGERISEWPKLGLYTAPYPDEKRKVLKKLKYDLGPYSHKLIYSKSVHYYNNNQV